MYGKPTPLSDASVVTGKIGRFPRKDTEWAEGGWGYPSTARRQPKHRRTRRNVGETTTKQNTLLVPDSYFIDPCGVAVEDYPWPALTEDEDFGEG